MRSAWGCVIDNSLNTYNLKYTVPIKLVLFHEIIYFKRLSSVTYFKM